MTYKVLRKKKSTRKERRLAIVEDVLDRLQEFRFVKSNGYITDKEYKIINMLNDVDGDTQLQKHVCDIKKHCQVCALGGLFLGAVDKYNHLAIKEFKLDLTFYGNFRRYTIVQKLKKYFSKEQLDLIEVAFEGSVPYTINLPTHTTYEAKFFNKNIRSPRERMRRILQNILDNDGIFKPWKGGI